MGKVEYLLCYPSRGVSVSSPDNSVGNNNFNNFNLNAFDEVQQFTLTSDLVTDTGTIAAGTVIDSQYVFFDPPDTVTQGVAGNVEFDGAVLGLITSDGKLAATNFLGDAGITYQDPANVGLEFGDSVIIDGTNPNQIDWDTAATNPGDSVRVITAVGTPEPGTIFLMGFSLLSAFGFRWRTGARQS